MRGRSMLAVVAVLGAAGPARAGVVWEAPAECGTEAELDARVGAQLGRAPDAGELTADVTVVGGVDYRATLVIGDTPPRLLTGASCGEVVDAAALILALAIRDAAPIERRAVTEPAPARRPIALDLGVRGSVDAMVLPGPAAGIGPVLAITAQPRVTVAVGLTLWDGRIANPSSLIATDVSLVTGAIEVCVNRRRLQGCGVATGGPMTGRGLDDVGGSASTRWWTATGLALGASLAPARRWSLGARLEALATLERPRFVFDDGREGYRVPALTVRLGITVGVRILGGD